MNFRFPIRASLVFAAVMAISSPLLARDAVHHLDFKKVVAAATKDGQLDGSVRFYLKGQAHNEARQTFAAAVSNKKTNAFGKGEEEACEWALRSVLISFQEKAKSQGANAVVDLISYYKKRPWTNKSQYECHVGALMAGVAMQGRPAILP
jgi:hypothetical protein